MSETNNRSQLAGTVAENLRYLLLQNLGRMVVAEFWFGGDAPVRRCGLLTAVGTDYLLLTDEVNGLEIAGLLSALRLVTVCQSSADASATDATADNADSTINTTNSENAADGASDTAPDTSGAAPSVSPVAARVHSQAAFNYAKRKTRRLD